MCTKPVIIYSLQLFNILFSWKESFKTLILLLCHAWVCQKLQDNDSKRKQTSTRY